MKHKKARLLDHKETSIKLGSAHDHDDHHDVRYQNVGHKKLHLGNIDLKRLHGFKKTALVVRVLQLTT